MHKGKKKVHLRKFFHHSWKYFWVQGRTVSEKARGEITIRRARTTARKNKMIAKTKRTRAATKEKTRTAAAVEMEILSVWLNIPIPPLKRLLNWLGSPGVAELADRSCVKVLATAVAKLIIEIQTNLLKMTRKIARKSFGIILFTPHTWI